VPPQQRGRTARLDSQLLSLCDFAVQIVQGWQGQNLELRRILGIHEMPLFLSARFNLLV
jgi:hypothetical protein